MTTGSSLAELQFLLGRQQPLAVVIDQSGLGECAPGFLKVICQLCGDSKVLLQGRSMAPDEEVLAMSAGIEACCPAQASNEELGRILDVVLAGGFWLSPSAQLSLAKYIQAPVAAATATEPGDKDENFSALTDRQQDVVALVAKGASNKVIARELGITDRTVKAHLTSIFEKLGISDRLQLALYATRRNKAE